MNLLVCLPSVASLQNLHATRSQRIKPAGVPFRVRNIMPTRCTAGQDDSSEKHKYAPTQLLGLAASAFVTVIGMQGIAAGPAMAFGGEIDLKDISYEVVECKPNMYMPSKGRYVCAEFTATADNKLKRSVSAANVFGFINDKDDNSAAAVNLTGQSRTVLAPITNPVPLGQSQVKFDVVLDKESLDKGPLKLKGFKAVASAAEIDGRFKPFDDCELDPISCEN